MEERVPPHDDDNHIPLDDSDHHQRDDHHAHDEINMQIIPSPIHRGQETYYIIQVQKDQIYRVPPPEHAEIVERYRNPVTRRSRRRQCGFWFLSAFFSAAFIISVIVCVHRFTLSPKPPTFTVKSVVLNHPPASKRTGFWVSVQTANPNGVNDLRFGEGSTWLMYKGKEIGKGRFPPLDKEEPGKSDDVDVLIAPSKGVGLPKELHLQQPLDKKSKSKNHNNNKAVNLEMKMSIPVKMKTWLWTKDVHVKVKCEVEVDSLPSNAKILAQKCDVQL